MALTNNDIIKKLRVALKMRDEDIVQVLKLVDYNISTSELGAFFRNEDHPKYMVLQDQILRKFLDGLIIYKRGPRDGSGAPAMSPNRKTYNQGVNKAKGTSQPKSWQAKLEKDLPKKLDGPKKELITSARPNMKPKAPRMEGKIVGRKKRD